MVNFKTMLKSYSNRNLLQLNREILKYGTAADRKVMKEEIISRKNKGIMNINAGKKRKSKPQNTYWF